MTKSSKSTIYRGDLTITKENEDHYTYLTEVSGSIDVQEGATFTAPALTEVSGSIYVREV